MAAILFVASLFSPASGEAQVLGILSAVSNGGSWVNLTVEGGRAEYRSPVLPVAGMAVNGCILVWAGHSGSWTVRAKDLLGEEMLEVTTESGKPVKFDYRAGLQAQLDLVVEWSEPKDTTLYLWVGVSLQDNKEKSGDRDICEPPPS